MVYEVTTDMDNLDVLDTNKLDNILYHVSCRLLHTTLTLTILPHELCLAL